MLTITIPASEERELWDERNEMYVYIPARKEQTLQLEHSLISISKWESKWCKAFLGPQEKTEEETIDYIRCMTLTQNVKPDVYRNLTRENVQEINQYIESPMTATSFSKQKQGRSAGDIITSELIYYWMIALNIPFECQKWHLNRLLALIRVCNIKNAPPKKMSRSELMRRNAALNAERRQKLNSRG